ncbi:MAG TPA: hypothetical protein VGW78_03570 [Candidatus Babeliales bacterium]|jgi:hypothetical protein|nr:hypothetical protein [Candidatus Babeliales bacterium]
MGKRIFQARPFKRDVDSLLKKRLLLRDDFDEFQKVLTQNPEMGDIIVGTGGKSGGFRVCYYYVTKKYEIYLLWIYAKNVQEDLTTEDKKILKDIVKSMDEDRQ